VPFPFVPSHGKISSMDKADPSQTTEIARAYLKQIRQQPGSTREGTSKPEVEAWLRVEQRLMLGSEPDKSKETRPTLLRRILPMNKAPKKAQSIWKRPISDLWR
jgi:hypothetical protein